MFSLTSRGAGRYWRRAALAGLLALLASGQARAAVEPEGFLVAPFENGSPVKALDWMAGALALTAAEKLEALPQLRPAYGSGVLDGWPARFEAVKAAERAREAGARWVLAGSFSRPNWKAGIALRLFEVVPDGKGDGKGDAARLVASVDVVGEREQLIGVLDKALDELLAKRGWTPSGEALAALHRAPTRDLYAFTLFGRGLGALFALGVPESLDTAEKTLERVVHIDPKFAEAHRMLGRVHLARSDENKAIGQFAYALDLKPGYYAATVGLARLYYQSGKRAPAREMAERALAQRPYDVEMRQLQGTLELEAGELDAALADLKAVVEARPSSVAARRVLAQVHAARGEITELAADLERVSELQPDDIEVRFDLGSALMRLGRHDRAAAVYEDVVKRQPKSSQAHKFIGDLYRRMGDPQRAALAYERMRHLLPNDPRPYFLLGAAYAEAGRDDKAVAVLEDAQQFKSYLGEAWTDLGALALRKGDVKRAEVLLTKAVARSPLRPKAHFNYALLLQATKQPARALTEAKAAIELDPEEADYHYLGGVILLRMGRLDEAKAEFTSALRCKPDHADAKFNLALLESLDRRYGSERSGVGAQ